MTGLGVAVASSAGQTTDHDEALSLPRALAQPTEPHTADATYLADDRVSERSPQRMTARDGGLSSEARAWLAAEPGDDDAPMDFSRIAEDRRDTLTRWHEASRRAIDRHGVIAEQVDVAGVECLRVTHPGGETPTATMMYVFGGAFIHGDPFSELPITAALAEFGGLEIICPNYRLAPEHPAPAAADDCLAVWRELCAAASGQKLLLGGESAGGNLALVTAQRARDEALAPPAAMALLSPAVDLRVDAHRMAAAPEDPTLSKTRMADVARAYPGDLAIDHPLVSPIFASMNDLAPTIITTGTRDMLLPGCLRLTRKMLRAGVDVTCRVWDGLWHVFEFYDAYPEAEESLREIADFLTRHLG